MNDQAFLAGIQPEIETEYARRGDRSGWGLLYSPARTLSQAKVAVVALNPGGRDDGVYESTISSEKGSAYHVEQWNAAEGTRTPFQQQVIDLYQYLGLTPEEVLSGILVPFRSRSWAALQQKGKAVEFGQDIWRRLLERARPRLVIAIGGEAARHLKPLLVVPKVERIPLNWGNVHAERGHYEGGLYVRLPHLSRYRIVGRAASAEAMERLFAGYRSDTGPQR